MNFMSRRRVLGAFVSTALSIGAVGTVAAAGYDGMTIVFEKPVDQVQKAAVDALTVVGVAIKKNEPNLVEGKRKNKMGAFVGSGGEVISVTLTAVDAGKTEAKVRTTKTFVGRAGQKVWDQPVIDEMTKSLAAPDSSTASAPAPASPAAP